MSRKFIGRPIYTADNSATPPAVTQEFNVVEKFILRAVRSTVIFNGNPAFTTMTAKLYADRGSAPKKLIATSTTSHAKADLLTLAHGFKETYFEFDHVTMYPETKYHLAIVMGGYTGNAGSHVAWAVSWPDPVYRTGLTVNQAEAGGFPLTLSVIGSAL